MSDNSQQPTVPMEPDWARVHNAALDMRISELREAIKLIQGRIDQLEAEKQRES